MGTLVSAAPPHDEQLLLGIVEASPDAVVVIDEQGAIVRVNAAAEHLFGYRRDELLRQSVEQLVPEGLRAAHRAACAAFMDAPHARAMGARLAVCARSRDGREIPVEIALAPVRTTQGLFVAALVRDVTEQRHIERSLREAEERFRLAFEDAPIGLALVALDGRFLRANHALCEIVGYSAGELASRTFQQLTRPDEPQADVAVLDALARGVHTRDARRQMHRSDGRLVEVVVNASLVRDRATAAPLHYIVQFEDVTERARAEEALRASESRFRDLVEQASDGIFIADLDGRYTSVNSAACAMLGYAREELVGKTIVDLIPPADVPRLEAARERLLRPGAVDVAEWQLRGKDGAFVPVEVSTRILADGRWLAFVRDVRERKHAQRALARSEESLARAQRVAHVGSWDWDVRTNEVWRSDEFFALFGMKPDRAHVQPFSFRGAIPEEELHELQRVVDEAAHAGRGYEMEHRIIRADGEERVVVQRGEALVENGQTVRMVGTMLDVTERKQADRERERAAVRLRTVLEQCPVGILIIDAPSGRIEQNGRAAQLMGRRTEPGRGLEQNVGFVLGADGKPLAEAELPAFRALRGERVDAEMLVRRPSGETLPVLVTAGPIVDERGDVIGAVVAFEDISALKQLENLRIEWNSIVAHDLRQPLNAIAVSARLLLRRAGSDERLREPIDGILRAGGRLNRMVQDLLDLSRLEVRKLPLARGLEDVGALVRASAERLTLEAPDRELDLRIDVAPLAAVVDADRIAQILENLLSNAVKYGRPASPIRVEVRRAGGEIVVSVTNEGTAIPAAELPHVFDRFYRAEGAQRGPAKGLGLGLYIVRELVEAHGGKVAAESDAGKTTFRFALPAAEAVTTSA